MWLTAFVVLTSEYLSEITRDNIHLGQFGYYGIDNTYNDLFDLACDLAEVDCEK